jgi:adenylate cyclase
MSVADETTLVSSSASQADEAGSPEGTPGIPQRDNPVAPNSAKPKKQRKGKKRRRNTVDKRVEKLLRGEEKFTLRSAAKAAEMTVAEARRFWLSMGFPVIQDEDHDLVFTDDDVAAMSRQRHILRSGALDQEAISSLVRGESHTADRLALWQYETLAEYAERVLGLDGISARFWVLDHVGDFQEFFSKEISYAWRRHLASLLRRSEAEASSMDLSNADEVQLQRALGFADMVSFTHHSNELAASELVTLIETFETTCRDVITSHGARVVKTIGDAFLYIADDLVTGAEVAMGIVEKLRQIPGMLPVRASLVWGGVVSRYGDVFGPTVNLASRLVDVAPSGGVLTDRRTANIMTALGLEQFALVPAGAPDLQGLGRVETVELRRLPARV